MKAILRNRYGQTLGVVDCRARTFKKRRNRGFVGFTRLVDPETNKCYSVFVQLSEMIGEAPVETTPSKQLREKEGINPNRDKGPN